jgi:hypothetical protein
VPGARRRHCPGNASTRQEKWLCREFCDVLRIVRCAVCGLCWQCDDLRYLRRVGVIRQRGSGKTRVCQDPRAGSLVVASVCHAAGGGGQRPAPGLGCFRAGRKPADRVVPAPGGTARAPGGRPRGRGGDGGIEPGGDRMLPQVRARVVSGARRVRADGGRRRDRGAAGADRAAGAPVPLPAGMLPCGHLRGAGRRGVGPVPAAQRAAAGDAGRVRPGDGRAVRRPAGRRARDRRAPRHGAAPGGRGAGAGDHRRAGSARGRRLRAGQGPGVRDGAGRHEHRRRDRPAAGPGGRHLRGVAERTSRRGNHLPGPGRQLCRGRQGGRARRDPGRRSLASMAQPGRIRREDSGRPPRLPDRPAGRRQRRRRRGRAGHCRTAGPGATGPGSAGRVPGRVRPGAPPGDTHPGTPRRDPPAAGRRPLAVRDQPRHQAGPQDRAAVRPPAAPGNCRARPPAGNRSWISSPRTSASGGTKASPTPPRSMPNCANAAGPAASRPSAATSGHSGRRSPPRTRPRPSPRPARSPAGC